MAVTVFQSEKISTISARAEYEKVLEIGSEPKPEAFGDWPNDLAFENTHFQNDPVALNVKGRIPTLLAGTLYRTGPGLSRLSDTAKGEWSCDHWFDGLTCIHRFHIVPATDGNCKVFYNSRNQVDEVVERIRKTGDFDGFTFAQRRDPCMSYFQKLKSAFRPQYLYADGLDIPNIGVTLSHNPPDWAGASDKRGKRVLIARTDAAIIAAVDPETLEPAGIVQRQHELHPSLTGWMSATHAQTDPLTGDVFNFNLSFGMPCTYRVFTTAKATGKTTVLATIRDLDVRPTYLHSFFLSTDYIILCIWGSHFAAGGAWVLWEKNILDAMGSFNPSIPAKWLVIDRKHNKGLVAQFDSPAMFAFHTINSWQEPQSDGTTDIYCDLIQYPTLDILHRFYYQNLKSTGTGVQNWAGDNIDRSSQKPRLARYRLSNIPNSSLDPNSVHHQQLPPLPITGTAPQLLDLVTPLVGDLPVINSNFHTRRHRYVYTLADRGFSSFVDSIAKLDIETQTVTYWSHPHHTPGEAMFFPKEATHADKASDEDDGYLVSVVLDGDRGQSYMLVLDARTMQEVGRAEVLGPVGIGFHGVHVKA